MAATFWITLAAAVGILAAFGHCMTARWAFAPVCGFDFWRVIVISPEVLIFMYFMITDPKTVPVGRVGRVVFGFLVAVVSTLLMAPQAEEFGTKVALLGGLVLVCVVRPLIDRWAPDPGSEADDVRRWASGLVIGGGTGPRSPRRCRPGGVARRRHRRRRDEHRGRRLAGTRDRRPDTADILGRVPHDVDPATFPSITVQQDVADWNHEIAGRASGSSS